MPLNVEVPWDLLLQEQMHRWDQLEVEVHLVAYVASVQPLNVIAASFHPAVP